MALHITTMSSPAVELGACQPPLAVEAIRKRRHSSGAPPRSTATAYWSARPAQGNRSARSVLIRKTPRLATGLKSYEISPTRQNYSGPRFASYAHSVARRSFLLKRRQASQQALLQRAAKPNFFSSRRNTLSQTLPAFGARCQPRRCLRSSRWTSVVSSYRSNPTHRVSPSLLRSARCHPSRSRERFPI